MDKYHTIRGICQGTGLLSGYNQEEIDNENLWVVFHPQKQKCQLILRTNWHFYSRTKKTHY